ncbi:hypothetical protein ACHQM5_004838 [Ranunculus cassubicifolius]
MNVRSSSIRPKPQDGASGYVYIGLGLVAFLFLCTLFWLMPSYSSSPPHIHTTTSTTPSIHSSTLLTNCTHSPHDSSPPHHLSTSLVITNCTLSQSTPHDPPTPTFYDDPKLSYTIDKPVMRDWDQKRTHWLNQHPEFAIGVQDRILMVSGSQTTPCKNPIGDHLLLRFFKNKVDYCRIHGYNIFYNNVLFHPKMGTWWSKVPSMQSAMIAHPEAEWIWWVDSDAAITDMDFKLPLDKYKDHNFVVHGWPHLIHEKKSWVGLNAGVFMIRNCQWSMDFLDVWASMSPIAPDYDNWGKILTSTFKEKIFPESDDQSALVYLILKEKEKWGTKIFLENKYYFQGYWLDIVDTLDEIAKKHQEIEKKVSALRRRHAEKVSEYYATMREKYVNEEFGDWGGKGSWRKPFITHFTGCQPCGGDTSTEYAWKTCWDGMQKVLNFADNQVLRSFGFRHRDLLNSSSVVPTPFDYPSY